SFWPVAFFGLTYKFWLALNIVLALFWLSFSRKRWIYNAFVIAIGVQFITRNIQWNEEAKETADFTLASFNTHVQQVYDGGNTSNQIDNYLADSELDIAILVEWLNKKGKISFKEFPYQQMARLNDKGNRHDYGIKAVSKHKIVNWDIIKFNHTSGNIAAFFDIEINGQVVRVFAVHLQSNSISSSDYHKMMKLDVNDKDYRNYAVKFVSRLRTSFDKRAEQTRLVKEAMADCPYPIIVLGDFNDTPQSYTYEQLRDGRQDAFIERGRGWGATFLKPFSLLRIDYILHDKELKCTEFSSTSEIASDHKLIQAGFTF
ncbi:MAG: hypothetical protein RLZZ337_1309, partial [Bacteroidota bacterium]